AGYYDPLVNSRLISPAFLVPDASLNPRIRFWHWFSFSIGDYGKVQIKILGGNTWVDLSGQYINSSNNSWLNPFLDLSAYAGKTVQISFLFYSNSDGYVSTGWYIDDITLEPDPGICYPNLILSPANIDFGLINLNTSMTDTVNLTNSGCDTLIISNITHTLGVFSLSAEQFIVLPHEQSKLVVSFNPIISGPFNDTLIIYNTNSLMYIPVRGQGDTFPSISINPSSASFVASCVDSISSSFSITNSGAITLNYIISPPQNILVNPASGILAVNDTVQSGITIITTGLQPGTYQYTILVNSNDPLHPGLSLPVTLTLTNNLNIDAGVDQLYNGIQPIQLNTNINGGTAPFTYLWSPATALSSSQISNPLASPQSNTVYTVHVTDANGCSGQDEVLVSVMTLFPVGGSVTYDNSISSPIPNAKVLLRVKNGELLDSTLTSSDGHYIFENVPAGNYELTASSNIHPGSINSTDALLIQKHIVHLHTLTGLKRQAADVNNSLTLTTADALLVLRKTVLLDSIFAAGKWFFEKPEISVNNAGVTHDLRGICFGDVNASFDPTGLKKAGPTISMEYQSAVYPGREFVSVPIRNKNRLDIGALTLNLNYPGNLLQLENIHSGFTDLLYSSQSGKVRMAWTNTPSQVLEEGEILCTLVFRLVRTNFTVCSISLDPESEFADSNADVLKDIILVAPLIKLNPSLSEDCNGPEFLVFPNYPNPFDQTTHIDFFIAEPGTLSLEVYNMTGEKLMVSETGCFDKGNHSLLLNASHLSPGLYFYRLQYQAAGNSSFKTSTFNVVKY
ncbi:MAG: carboxypeptidase regulatory-like domain-containing protein, partial [Bacteroidetes bacterium]|nr:carboxypeptidase regulatory-like domain-containing protein [Bacteroidota bacterium]